MTLPYRHRLLAHYGSSTVELARFQRPIHPHEMKYWTAGVEHWSHERTLSDRECISDRPLVGPYHAQRVRIKLSAAEREALEERGLVQEYRVSA